MTEIGKQILEQDDLVREKIEIPEWGVNLWVRTITGTERDAFEQSIADTRGKVNMVNIRGRMSALVLEDDQGNRVFSEAEAAALGKKSAAVLDRIFAVAQRLNGMSNKDVEDLAKNSEAAPSGDSTSV